MGRRQVRGFSRHQDEAELFFASLTGIAAGSNAGRTPRAEWNAEQFFAELAGESTESFTTSPAVFRAIREPEPLPEPAAQVMLGGPEGNPPLDTPYPSYETGEAVDVTPIEADESPLSLDKLLAIDTSKMVESWDDRSSAT
jgi:hypothetical protein